ncbi:MAG TPA: HAMP domain-containing sensor histidine kinase [Nocardioidaceae bacterium]
MAARWTPYRSRRLRLADRVALAFALMALVLSVVLAAAAWLLGSSYVNHQNEMSAVAQTVDNALLVRERLRSGSPAGQSLVDRLRYPPGAASLLVYDDRSYPSASAVQIEMPDDLSLHVRRGAEEYRRIELGGEPYLVVGVPLSRHGDAFFEFYSLADLRRTLEILWVVLLVGAVGTSLVGLALGRLASHRMLRPLDEVTSAAAAIAHGDLSARLSTDADPDLADLAGSFNRTADALEHRVRADARFAGDVSHELRTPLTTMLNSLALLQNRRHELPPDVVEPLDLLSEELQRFRKLVVDLLDISKSDGGVPGVGQERVLLADLARRAADTAAGRPVTVVDPDAEGLVVQADKRRLERVLTNLVENAEVHGRGCHAVRVQARAGMARVEVEDHGDGIPVGLRERIFERFARDGAMSGTGVGLGLAIVARHVQWHGGEVWVEDAEGRGARFVVQLPVVREAGLSHRQREAAEKRNGHRPALAPVVSEADGAGSAPGAALPAASRTPGSPGPPAHR